MLRPIYLYNGWPIYMPKVTHKFEFYNVIPTFDTFNSFIHIRIVSIYNLAGELRRRRAVTLTIPKLMYLLATV